MQPQAENNQQDNEANQRENAVAEEQGKQQALEHIKQNELQNRQQNNEANDEDLLSEQDQEAYHKIMSSISKMKQKLSVAKGKITESTPPQPSELAAKIIESKEAGDIMSKESLVTDITESYEKVVVQVYSENQKLKAKIQEMSAIIKQQNNKIYQHIQLEEHLKKQNLQIRKQITEMKDQKLNLNKKVQPLAKKVKKQSNQKEDFDFWSMPQNQVKKNDLWANQKDIGESVFLTQGRKK